MADQFGAPTSAALLADVTAHVLGRYQREKTDFPYGLYHLVAAGLTSWHAYAQHVIAAGIAAGKPLKLNPDTVRAITTADYPLPAPRPATSHLATEKFTAAFGLHLPAWQCGLDHVLQHIL